MTSISISYILLKLSYMTIQFIADTRNHIFITIEPRNSTFFNHIPELELTFQDLEGDSSRSEGSSDATQTCLNVWLKGGKAENSRVSKFKVYTENIVAQRLKFGSEREAEIERTHPGGGDQALYHSISRSTSSSIFSLPNIISGTVGTQRERTL